MKKKRASLIEAERRLQETLRLAGYTGTKAQLFANEIPNYKVASNVQSNQEVCSSGAPRKSQVYTGTEILGIGLMHKSNFVPIRKDSNEAIEISKMRRG